MTENEAKNKGFTIWVRSTELNVTFVMKMMVDVKLKARIGLETNSSAFILGSILESYR